tara:strand:+ start:3886 stop:4050 length:165 start_codon:yes stop_codon:yes gene_type:complete
MITENTTEYKQNTDGSLSIVKQGTIEIEAPSDLIAKKEAELLSMYKELEALKNS